MKREVEGWFVYHSGNPKECEVVCNDYLVISLTLTERGIKSIVEKHADGTRTLTTEDHYAGSEGCEFTFNVRGKLLGLKSL